ncbi:phosphatase [Anoxybacter fermentans]|uniref:Phosphatase n=1 Tax=Anoxybacter fermentans TaxID=1323375 RepID=A0A3S9SWF4_9FIRM|nr:PHP domain-containing protein [Anoxybacter fermentans]AZR72619.1 phosphatase [Anoxybacter fermentans]
MAIDLHLHTTASDGTYTPTEIVDEAKKLGLTAIAITDHDNMNGVEEALKRGKEIGLEVVPGIELNTDYEEKEIHILGYYLNYSSKEVHDILDELINSRVNRAQKMVEKLNQMGINISYERVKEIAVGGAIGRPHIAKALIEAGYAEDWSEAFDRFIGRDCPAYVPRTKLTPFAAIKLILNAGGVPVLAHPGLNNLDEIIPGLIEAGLMGIEVYHFEHTGEDKVHYLKMAQKNNLIITGGSDCHGPGSKSGARLGQVKLPEQFLTELKKGLSQKSLYNPQK